MDYRTPIIVLVAALLLCGCPSKPLPPMRTVGGAEFEYRPGSPDNWHNYSSGRAILELQGRLLAAEDRIAALEAAAPDTDTEGATDAQ